MKYDALLKKPFLPGNLSMLAVYKALIVHCSYHSILSLEYKSHAGVIACLLFLLNLMLLNFYNKRIYNDRAIQFKFRPHFIHTTFIKLRTEHCFIFRCRMNMNEFLTSFICNYYMT